MRFRAGSTLIYPLLLAVTVSTGLFLNAGCGGGSSDPRPQPSQSGTPTPTPSATPTPVPQPVRVQTTIIWGPRSRQVTTANAVGGPSSALSAEMTLTAPGGTTALATEVLNRDVPEGRQNYTTTASLTPGIYILSVTFKAGRDNTGDVVGTASASATVLPTGVLTTTIATFGRVQSVQVIPGQTVNVGQTKPILYQAKDRDGVNIAVSTGSAFIEIADNTTASTVAGQQTATAQGEDLTGVTPASVRIQVRVDEARSPVAEIPVRSNVTLDINPKTPTVSLLRTQQFTAAVANDGPAGATGVTWSVVKVENNVEVNTTQAAIDANGVFTATRVEGDFRVIATSRYDPNVVVRIPVRVESLVNVVVTPAAPGTVSFKGGQLQFTATVNEVPEGSDRGVRWSVVTENGGSINADGLFTASDRVGKVRIRATSIFDTRKFTEVEFDVASLAVVTVTPATVPDVIIRTTFDFDATVTNVPSGQDTGVNWTVEGGNANGTIDAAGLYTAPATPGDYVVVATSRFDPTKVVRRTVPVRSPITVTVPAATAELSIRELRTFTATVNLVPAGFDAGVTWSLSAAPRSPAGTNLGTLDTNTGAYQAPALPVGVILTATSRFDPTKSAQIAVTVVSRVTITFTPASPVTVSINAIQQLNATVGGVIDGGDTGVEWRVVTANGGTITATGSYTAPATPGDYIVEARSNFDPTKTAQITVRVRSGNLGVVVN